MGRARGAWQRLCYREPRMGPAMPRRIFAPSHRPLRLFLAVQKDAVTGVEIFHPPLAVLIRHFDMLAADIFMFYGDVAGIGPADAERRCEFTFNGRHDVANGDMQNGDLETELPRWVIKPGTLF